MPWTSTRNLDTDRGSRIEGVLGSKATVGATGFNGMVSLGCLEPQVCKVGNEARPMHLTIGLIQASDTGLFYQVNLLPRIGQEYNYESSGGSIKADADAEEKWSGYGAHFALAIWPTRPGAPLIRIVSVDSSRSWQGWIHARRIEVYAWRNDGDTSDLAVNISASLLPDGIPLPAGTVFPYVSCVAAGQVLAGVSACPPPGAQRFTVYQGPNFTAGNMQVRIEDAAGNVISNLQASSQAYWNRAQYNTYSLPPTAGRVRITDPDWVAIVAARATILWEAE